MLPHIPAVFQASNFQVKSVIVWTGVTDCYQNQIEQLLMLFHQLMAILREGCYL